MVALSDLQRANQLASEKRSLLMAIESFDHGGVILSMTVGPRPPDDAPFSPRPMGLPVPTETLDYPPQMIEQIKAKFNARLHEIEHELTGLGITDIEAR